MTVELELIIKIFGGAVSVSIGVFVWWFKGWIETNVTKPQNENKLFNEKFLKAIDEVNKKVEKISQIQDGRKGVEDLYIDIPPELSQPVDLLLPLMDQEQVFQVRVYQLDLE